VFLRPENVRLVPEGPGAATTGTVQESTFLGSFRRTIVHGDDGTLVRVQHAAGERVEYGQRVGLAVAPDPVSVRASA